MNLDVEFSFTFLSSRLILRIRQIISQVWDYNLSHYQDRRRKKPLCLSLRYRLYEKAAVDCKKLLTKSPTENLWRCRPLMSLRVPWLVIWIRSKDWNWRNMLHTSYFQHATLHEGNEWQLTLSNLLVILRPLITHVHATDVYLNTNLGDCYCMLLRGRKALLITSLAAEFSGNWSRWSSSNYLKPWCYRSVQQVLHMISVLLDVFLFQAFHDFSYPSPVAWLKLQA